MKTKEDKAWYDTCRHHIIPNQKEKSNQQDKEWYKNNKEYKKNQSLLWRKKNPYYHLSRKEYMKEYYQRKKNEKTN